MEMDVMVNERPLTAVEQDQLNELESIIRENMTAWYAVGMAMIEIRDRRLYRNDEGRTWDGYCREIFDMSHQHADRQIAAAKVIENLTPIGVSEEGQVNWELLPANESQARQLSVLPADQQQQVWQSLVEKVQNKECPRITAKAVKNAVSGLQDKTVKDKISDAKAKGKSATRWVEQNWESEEFTTAWESLMDAVEIQHRYGWKHTSREVVFETLVKLAGVIGECGNSNFLDRRIAFRANNTEKLLTAGFSIFRIQPSSSVIEQLEADGTWLTYGEYESLEQRDEVFADMMLDGKNIQA